MIVNHANLADLFRGFQTSFQRGFAGVTPAWSTIATPVPSTTSEEKYAWLGQFPMLREWLGERQVKSIAAHDYTVKNKKFESTVSVDRDELDDDRYGIYSILMEQMGQAAATHPDELVFAQLGAGFTSLCYDGQYFFDTDHPVGIPGQTAVTSVSNHGGGSGTAWYLLDCSRPLKPVIFQRRRDYALRALNDVQDSEVFKTDKFLYGVDARVNTGFGFWQMAHASKQTLDATNYEAARAAMKSIKSDEGRPLGIRPTHWVGPPSLESAAKSLFQTMLVGGGDTNPNYNDVQVIVAPWL